ncbi:MAG: 2-amino-4-hydroxy-6-hydroxymethyldihydropteridine diphosphokinase [Bacteroidales bacterium]|nr:2-amino-4-hydroxy-6-hydroxymethyldihydropteridine diphosphokinase [Bacteroidales bacterium]
MPKLYLSLGSNLGDREKNLSRAISMLSKALGSEAESVSSFIETKAWGFDGPDFLNCAVRYECKLGPFAVLDICKDIETALGRVQNVEYDTQGRRIYHSRPVDIDILLYGDLRMVTETLEIPHPRMEEREFVQIPLRQIFERND